MSKETSHETAIRRADRPCPVGAGALSGDQGPLTALRITQEPRNRACGLAALALATAALAQYGDISTIKLLKPEDKDDIKSVPPPKDAIVLFDGKSLDGWVKTSGKDKAPLGAGQRGHAGQGW